ncbi:hypothetical protein PUN28_017110 [Cardiocondyla obscurior]|uniref:Ribosomal protein S11 n=1 Tax=Cardiocondyla obscurior TaxID=286306 RepID=A0AAW2ER80_9HYME
MALGISRWSRILNAPGAAEETTGGSTTAEREGRGESEGEVKKKGVSGPRTVRGGKKIFFFLFFSFLSYKIPRVYVRSRSNGGQFTVNIARRCIAEIHFALGTTPIKYKIHEKRGSI